MNNIMVRVLPSKTNDQRCTLFWQMRYESGRRSERARTDVMPSFDLACERLLYDAFTDHGEIATCLFFTFAPETVP